MLSRVHNGSETLLKLVMAVVVVMTVVLLMSFMGSGSAEPVIQAAAPTLGVL